jgi:acylphosphatase
MKARAHVFVAGEVQGVFFRSQIRQEARTRNVKGWVSNLLDGRVEAVFEGEDEAVEALVGFCHSGPPGARVANVDVIWENYEGKFDDFGIKYV